MFLIVPFSLAKSFLLLSIKVLPAKLCQKEEGDGNKRRHVPHFSCAWDVCCNFMLSQISYVFWTLSLDLDIHHKKLS